jgi:hypothetical protein
MTCGHNNDGQCDVHADCGYTHCCHKCEIRGLCKSKCQMPEE